MKRAVIIIGNGFEDSECLYPFYRLQEAGFSVDVATKGQAPVAGKHGIPMTPTVDAEAVRAEDYDMAVIPGITIWPLSLAGTSLPIGCA